jgi:hypothetical protein
MFVSFKGGSHHGSLPPDQNMYLDFLMNTNGGGSNDPPMD